MAHSVTHTLESRCVAGRTAIAAPLYMLAASLLLAACLHLAESGGLALEESGGLHLADSGVLNLEESGGLPLTESGSLPLAESSLLGALPHRLRPLGLLTKGLAFCGEFSAAAPPLEQLEGSVQAAPLALATGGVCSSSLATAGACAGGASDFSPWKTRDMLSMKEENCTARLVAAAAALEAAAPPLPVQVPQRRRQLAAAGRLPVARLLAAAIGALPLARLFHRLRPTAMGARPIARLLHNVRPRGVWHAALCGGAFADELLMSLSRRAPICFAIACRREPEVSRHLLRSLALILRLLLVRRLRGSLLIGRPRPKPTLESREQRKR
eukprot:CAMPEP_0113265306 /NCGR_PEP_ID=MMETSP0008_2-20120614/19428_1 /TAXON_ID=97485 /ORGANISM="Prymnesium parvum" /LENGTH=326 /DNA_ID=CAMNT_0000114109 /DNA_START=239 /DNA_END=1220 /DNA_ORIENTATION=- /assembly_acc=CAM_ASM_000153